LRAMGSPMFPRPMKPTRSSIPVSPSRSRDSSFATLSLVAPLLITIATGWRRNERHRLFDPVVRNTPAAHLSTRHSARLSTRWGDGSGGFPILARP
jgi:hypothetical protein